MTDIRTSWLMTSSAAVLAVIGIALSYLPRECLTAAGADASPRVVVLAQLTGAMALAWAILDWMARRQRIGGIYNRPPALANWLPALVSKCGLRSSTTPRTPQPAASQTETDGRTRRSGQESRATQMGKVFVRVSTSEVRSQVRA